MSSTNNDQLFFVDDESNYSAAVDSGERNVDDSSVKNLPRVATTTTTTPTTNQLKKKKVALLICPAQFCVPKDYDVFFENLAELADELPFEIASSSTVVPLSRTDWIKVSRQLLTREFLEARLSVPKTLDWYFHAMEEGFSQIFAEEMGQPGRQSAGEDVSICIVGHSIGGWVARAYLGGLSHSSSAVHRLAMERCSSFITLGTPHGSTEMSSWVDQTRGLLRAIEESPSCQPQRIREKYGIDITCVASSGIRGGWINTSNNNNNNNEQQLFNMERWLATLSYFSFGMDDKKATTTTEEEDEGGEASWKGDGIVPLSWAFLDDSTRVVLEQCNRTGKPIRHVHVLPTPWNLWDGTAPSIPLTSIYKDQEYPSYISKGVVEQWAPYIS